MQTIDLDKAKAYLKMEPTDTEEDELLSMFIAAAKDYICCYTNKTIEELAHHASYAVVCMLLVGDFYETRQTSVLSGKMNTVNEILSAILTMYRNLE